MHHITEKPRGSVWIQDFRDIVGTISLSHNSVFLWTSFIEATSMHITLPPTYILCHEVYMLLLQQPRRNDSLSILIVLIKATVLKSRRWLMMCSVCIGPQPKSEMYLRLGLLDTISHHLKAHYVNKFILSCYS